MHGKITFTKGPKANPPSRVVDMKAGAGHPLDHHQVGKPDTTSGPGQMNPKLVSPPTVGTFGKR